MDRIIIADIIAIIIHWRLVDGTNPKGRYAKFFQITQLLNDTLDITNAITIGIIKAFGIDLINHFLLPPMSHKCILPFLMILLYHVFYGSDYSAS